jgi:flagellar biosynthesis/type III secretory pathway protein FliH
VEYMTIQQKLLDEKNLSFQEGEAAGLQKGLQKGEARFSALIQKMLKDNLSSEIPRVTEDSEFRNAMYQKYKRLFYESYHYQ